MQEILFRVILVVTLCNMALVVGGCAKSGVVQGSASNQVVAPSSSTVGPASPAPPSGEQPPTPSTEASLGQKIDACALLTSQEIRSVQGESLKETKASGSVEGGFNNSQCFFALPTFTNSVSLVVTQKGDGAGARDPKEFWEETFEGEQEAEADKKREKKSEREREAEAKKSRTKNEREEEEEEAAPPQKVLGVGDEAFWTGSRVGGALYVLKGNTYVRVSVGGKGDQQAKINKSKALARLALKRL